MKNLKLIDPNLKYRDSFLEFVDELDQEGIDEWFFSSSNSSRKTLQPYLQMMADERVGKNLTDGKVPASMYWLVHEKEVIGRVSIRHELNDYLLHRGGHIGYYIKPSKWNQGYGFRALVLGLEKMSNWDVQEVLVTTDDTNHYSYRIIEKCGGILENKIQDEHGNLVRRYWISL